jgi:hypothetical protein
MQQLRHSMAVAICAAGLALTCAGKEATLTRIKVYPSEIQFSSARNSQRVIVEAAYSNDLTADVTAEARLRMRDSKIARTGKGFVVPLKDGATELLISYKGKSARIPITITNSNQKAEISFRNDVMPVFLKAGCNAGSCHGSSKGKDGFRLSLFGFDPDGDYFRLTREQIGRRINLAIPQESLIVQKGLGAVQHTGGVRFATNSDLCQILIQWLTAGAPKDFPNVARLSGIEIFPKEVVLGGTGAKQRLVVNATYSDGTIRDVTAMTVFISNNESAAKVDESGAITAEGRGEAFIQARYGEFNVGASIIMVPNDSKFNWPDVAANNYIDKLVYAKLKKMRLRPADLCDDATFLRRATLDLNGRLPSTAEVQEFCSSTVPDRRAKLVDNLIARKEFANLWVMKWAELLEIRSVENRVYPKATVLYFEWLRDQILENVSFDKIVRELLTSTGSNLGNPSANYYEVEPDPLKLAENTAQVFMGTRIQCAQCHNHPFDRWTMNDYYGFAAFFAQLGRKPGDDPRETVIFDRTDGETRHPVTGTPVKPKYLGGDFAEAGNGHRREALADWLTSPTNQFFARNLANLMWAQYFGRGIVDPVDDVRISNPASNPALLEALSAKIIEYHFDFKRMARDICASRTYQLSARPASAEIVDDRNFSHSAIRRIRAEVLLDSIDEVTETQDKFRGLPRGARAVEIADGNTSSYFLTTFGRATRGTVCSCEVKVDPNLSQALHLLNSESVQNKIESGGVVRRLLKQGKKPEMVIEELYLRCFGRKPDAEESEALAKYFQNNPKPERALNDVFWSLLNSKEFVFNH